MSRWSVLALALVAATSGLAADPLAEAQAGKYRGTIVRIAGPRSGASVLETLGDFSARTGIIVRFEAWGDFESVLAARIEAGLPPDIVEIRRPGLAESLAKKGRLVDVNKILDPATILAHVPPPWAEPATLTAPGGRILAGVWGPVEVQALVWYPRATFEAAGYQVPATWADLVQLQNRIKADGSAPWALGLGDGIDTGSSASAWVEALLLRVASPEVHDRWVKGRLKSTAPEVKKAVQALTDLWFTPGNVSGGRKALLATGAAEAGAALFTQPPRAWLFLAGGSAQDRFPPSWVLGKDYDAFPLPPVDPRFGQPLLVTGSLWSMMMDRPEVRAVLESLATAPKPESLVQALVVRWQEPDSTPWKVVLRQELKGLAGGTKTLDSALKSVDTHGTR